MSKGEVCDQWVQQKRWKLQVKEKLSERVFRVRVTNGETKGQREMWFPIFFPFPPKAFNMNMKQ